MGPGTSSRARGTITILVTLVVVLGEFGFLQAVYHMDDHVDVQHAAQARVAGALDAWTPGNDTAAVEEAVRALGTTDTAGAHRLQELTRTWAGSLDDADLLAVRTANTAIGQAVAREQSAVDRRAAIILATLLVLVSFGWFVWFRRLVQRHRTIQRCASKPRRPSASSPSARSSTRVSAGCSPWSRTALTWWWSSSRTPPRCS